MTTTTATTTLFAYVTFILTSLLTYTFFNNTLHFPDFLRQRLRPISLYSGSEVRRRGRRRQKVKQISADVVECRKVRPFIWPPFIVKAKADACFLLFSRSFCFVLRNIRTVRKNTIYLTFSSGHCKF